MVEDGSNPLVAYEKVFRGQFAMDMRIHCEEIRIGRGKKYLELQNGVIACILSGAILSRMILSGG